MKVEMFGEPNSNSTTAIELIKAKGFVEYEDLMQLAEQYPQIWDTVKYVLKIQGLGELKRRCDKRKVLSKDVLGWIITATRQYRNN